MRKSVIAAIAVFVGAFIYAPANAQDIKTVAWAELWQNITFSQSPGGEWEFSHQSRPLVEATLVQVPAGTLTIGQFHSLTGDQEASMYLVTLNPRLTVRITKGGVAQSVPSSARMLFFCRRPDSAGCRQDLRSKLAEGFTMQSTGSTGDEAGGTLPANPIFTFVLR
jgi:hypothetical protein